MCVTLLVQAANGQFCASLVGLSALKVVRPSRDEAIRDLRSELTAKVAAGELLDLDVSPLGISALAGTFRDDPSLPEICKEIYRERDAERLQ